MPDRQQKIIEEFGRRPGTGRIEEYVGDQLRRRRIFEGIGGNQPLIKQAKTEPTFGSPHWFQTQSQGVPSYFESDAPTIREHFMRLGVPPESWSTIETLADGAVEYFGISGLSALDSIARRFFVGQKDFSTDTISDFDLE